MANSEMGTIEIPKQLVLKLSGYVTMPRKTMEDKKVAINLNKYRNLHHNENNNVKRQSLKDVEQYLIDTGQRDIVFTKPVNVKFRYTMPKRFKMDKSNVYAVATKYFYDALVKLGVLEDDNDDFIKKETLYPTVYEKDKSEIHFEFTEIE